MTANTTARAPQGLLSFMVSPSVGIVRPKRAGYAPYILALLGHTDREKGGARLIKGISRRVIVVKSPDRRFFEEAIFIVREGAIGSSGVTADQVVEEARRVADGFVAKQSRRWYQRIPAPGYAVLGALLTSLAWGVSLLL